MVGAEVPGLLLLISWRGIYKWDTGVHHSNVPRDLVPGLLSVPSSLLRFCALSDGLLNASTWVPHRCLKPVSPPSKPASLPLFVQ